MIDQNSPFYRVRQMIQQVSWKDLVEGKEYHLELIQPLKAPIKKWNGRRKQDAFYIDILAESMEESSKPEFFKGQIINIGFTTNAFTNALSVVNKFKVESVQEEDNIRVKIKKLSKQTMRFLEFERMQPKPEHIEATLKHYQRQETDCRRETKVNSPEGY